MIPSFSPRVGKTQQLPALSVFINAGQIATDRRDEETSRGEVKRWSGGGFDCFGVFRFLPFLVDVLFVSFQTVSSTL